MNLAQVNDATAEAETLRNEVDELKDMLSRLSRASIDISENLDTETVLQQVVNSASDLTGARYCALLTFDPDGGARDIYTFGISPEQRALIRQTPRGMGLLGYLDSEKGPVRLSDASAHSESIGLPEGHPPVNTFLGMPVRHRDEHVGHLYLTEKEGGLEFTLEDENIAAMFAAQAASVISNTRRYEEAHRAKMELEALMDILPVSVSVFDTRVGKVTFANRETLRILGMMGVSDETVGNVYEFLRLTRPDGREIPFEDLPGSKALLTGEPVRADEVVIHTPNGDSITTLMSCAPLFSDTGEMLSVLTVVQDMTPLEELERQKNEFVGMVSEELWTPLTTIKGSATTLRGLLEPVNSMESIQLLRIIDQQTDLMRSQVNSLSELTQIETGTLSVAAEQTDVATLLEAAGKEYLGDHPTIDIRLGVPKDLPPVMADRHKIGQVLRNLFRRAARHSNEASPVQVSAFVIDIYVAIEVSAKGAIASTLESISPFTETDSTKLFEKLTRDLNEASGIKSEGEGLSVAFCRGVVEAHGGRMRVQVDEKAGSLTLTFTLPSVEETSKTRILSSGTREIVGEPALPPAEETSILVSITDYRLLTSVRNVLTGAGYGAIAASSLYEVEELASSGQAKLIVLDIAGREEECFRVLGSMGHSQNLPAIVLCERDDEDYVVRAFDMGADGYMVKPFSSSELIARIKATLRRLNAGGGGADNNTFRSGELLINFDERAVLVSGQPVQLTATEYKLLVELANGAGRVLTQDMVLERVWGPEYAGESQLLRSYVKSLRQKIGDNARAPSYIFTEHGIGYRMVKLSARATEQGPAVSERLGMASSEPRSGSTSQRNGVKARRIPKRWDFSMQ